MSIARSRDRKPNQTATPPPRPGRDPGAAAPKPEPKPKPTPKPTPKPEPAPTVVVLPESVPTPTTLADDPLGSEDQAAAAVLNKLRDGLARLDAAFDLIDDAGGFAALAATPKAKVRIVRALRETYHRITETLRTAKATLSTQERTELIVESARRRTSPEVTA
ncbi:MAG: hypothetical protein ACM35G_06905 [Planctomycetaceae bacterium]